MNAATWFYSQSFHNQAPEKSAEQPKPATIPVDRWDGQKWITVMVPNPEVKQ